MKNQAIAFFGLVLLALLLFGCTQQPATGDSQAAGSQDATGQITQSTAAGGQNMVGELVVEKGDLVKVDYTGTLESGEQFDSSIGREPLEFEAGAGQMIAGFDAAVIGMKIGGEKNIVLAPKDAYGESNPDMIVEYPKSSLPSEINPEVGMQLQSSAGAATITSIGADTITLDFNHRLAGKTLKFWIQVKSIQKAAK